MSIAKVLSDSGWKDISSKNKIKDNGLLKALADHKRSEAAGPQAVLESLEQITKYATQLKKSKEVAASSAVSKYVAEMLDAAEADHRTASKAKVEADKAAAAATKAQADKKGADEGEDEESSELLTTKLVPLLRSVSKGEQMHAVVASTGKVVAVMLSRKPIAKPKYKLLAEHLGVTGGVKYLEGHCLQEDGMTTFAMQHEVAGLSKKIKAALLLQTKLRVRLRCRGHDGQDDDEDGEGGGEAGGESENGRAEPANAASDASPANRPFAISSVVGRGGKNIAEDVQTIQAALNRRAGAGLKVDGHCGDDTIEAIENFQRALGMASPNGQVEPGRSTARALAAPGKIGKPPPPPQAISAPEDLGATTLARAPQVWHGMRELVDRMISELKRAVLQHYSNEHPDLLAEIDRNVQRVDAILDKLDTRLAQTLERAGAAKAPAQRTAEIGSAKKIVAEYIAFIKSEPLIDHIDHNPFGVKVQVRKTITDALAHMIKSMA